MDYAWDRRINLHVEGRISPEDALRQERTATEILSRFTKRPGVILADEVGMGKTFVALSVATSVALADSEHRPVVVMVPPSLKEKWPSDFAVFCDRCLPESLRGSLRCARAERAVEFLKLLDDPPSRRAHFIFLTHGAMSRSLGDKWVMLAIIYQALKNRWGVKDLRKNIARHAADLLQMGWVNRKAPEVWEVLLKKHPEEWLRILQQHGIDPENDDNPDTDDDPVPEAVREALPNLNTDEVYAALLDVPQRRSKHFDRHMKKARRAIKKELRSLWENALKTLKIRLPLLILDEAHHLKNAKTQLASLFQAEEARDDADELTKGPLAGTFERMIFLTATPFQLGHGELCSVLDRFEAIAWCGNSGPAMGRKNFQATVEALRETLDAAQESAVVLDSVWGRLTVDDLMVDDTAYDSSDPWWNAIGQDSRLTPNADQVAQCFRRTQRKMEDAEKLLRPWVLRHLKPRHLPAPHSASSRRKRLTGEAILNGGGSNGDSGLSVAGESLLPFLLAARATAHSLEARPVFAEGLASSYEAFLHTRALRDRRACEDLLDDDLVDDGHSIDTGASQWYLDNLEKLLPVDDPEASRSHPKISATVDRALDLWRSGEKVLVFCHYVATGRVLRQHLSDVVESEITLLGAKKLNCAAAEVNEELGRIGNRFFDTDSPIRRACDDEVGELLDAYPALAADRDLLIDVVRRNVRTPSFLVRYFPLERSTLDADAMVEALSQRDESGLSLRDLLNRFFLFLADRCTESERNRYIDAVQRVQTGTHLGADVARSFSPDELHAGRTERLLPNVRLVNGSTKQDTRQRLMLTFNTPFYPEILVASSVMAEGVDLHLNCRYVIHHDLCWNPSTLEQRTGRIDRIGAKAEHCGQPIHVYLPYVAETQDEKMYRVVTDRERWFNVVMGEEYRLDTLTTDRIAERIPLPAVVAESLAFDLSVV